MSSFQHSLGLARLTSGLSMNEAYSAALRAKEKLSPKQFRSISEHLVNVQAGKIEALVKNYAVALGEHAWSSQMIEGLNLALKKAGVEIVEVEGGATKQALHSHFFQTMYVEKFERSDENQQLHELVEMLKETKEEVDEDFAGLFEAELDDSAAGKLVANKLQTEVAKIVIYIQDLLCVDKGLPLQEDALRALDFALQINGHELKAIDPLKRLPFSNVILFQILKPKVIDKPDPSFDAREAELTSPTIEELKELIQDCVHEDNPDVFDQDILSSKKETINPLYFKYLQKVTELRENLTLEQVLQKLEEDIDLVNATFFNAQQPEEVTVNEDSLKFLGSAIKFNIENLKIGVSEDEEEVYFELETVTDEKLKIDFNTPYQSVAAYTWHQVEVLLNQFTARNGLFNLTGFADFRAEDTDYPLALRFLSTIVTTFGTAKAIYASEVKKAARAHYEKVLKDAKAQDELHQEHVEERKEQAVRAQRELHRQQREEVRVRASEEAASEEERSSLFSWFASWFS